MLLNNTKVPYKHRRVYRLIGRELYSAPTDKPSGEQEYTLEKMNATEVDRREAVQQFLVPMSSPRGVAIRTRGNFGGALVGQGSIGCRRCGRVSLTTGECF